jgi:hypothetical protein
MTLSHFLDSLTDAERDFIAKLDYGNNAEKHRQQLEVVIQNEGKVDMDHQITHPYEVIELGKSHLQKGHEREFAACMGIVLKNLLNNNDKMNDIDNILDNHMADINSLPLELKDLIHKFVDALIKES